jgi:hypothetical protein|tara:strand:+ start:4579 stop:5022 length:444 start_codon:yes stop_codon:yes gene_type:complete
MVIDRVKIFRELLENEFGENCLYEQTIVQAIRDWTDNSRSLTALDSESRKNLNEFREEALEYAFEGMSLSHLKIAAVASGISPRDISPEEMDEFSALAESFLEEYRIEANLYLNEKEEKEGIGREGLFRDIWFRPIKLNGDLSYDFS